MAFARWDPLRDLLNVQQRMTRLAPAPTGWTPMVDLLETEDRYILTMELPGLARDDVQLQVRDGRLSISGSRPEREPGGRQFHRIERGHGSFSRSFQLPVPIDAARIGADLQDGVLTVTCPKSPDGLARRIQIA